MLKHYLESPVFPPRVVVMGAAGFVGSAIVRELSAAGVHILSLTRKDVDLMHPEASDKLAALLRPDDSFVAVSAQAPCKSASTLADNITMVLAMCKALRKSPPAHIVNISSDAVYADGVNPVNERSCASPSSLHGVMHLAREVMLKNEVKSPLAILRPSLLYGVSDPHNGYGPNLFRRLAAMSDPIVLFGEGEECRDHVLVDDVARIISLCLTYKSEGTLNIATGEAFSFRSVAETVVSFFKKSVPISGTARKNQIIHRHFDAIDCLKSFPTFKYTSLQQGLAKAHQDMMKENANG